MRVSAPTVSCLSDVRVNDWPSEATVAGRAAASRLRLPTSATSIMMTTSLLANITFISLSLMLKLKRTRSRGLRSARARSTALVRCIECLPVAVRARGAWPALQKSFTGRRRRLRDHTLLHQRLAVLLDLVELAEGDARRTRVVAFDAHDFAVEAARAVAQEEHGARGLRPDERAVAAFVAEDARHV